jgi:hypothetical protein
MPAIRDRLFPDLGDHVPSWSVMVGNPRIPNDLKS